MLHCIQNYSLCSKSRLPTILRNPHCSNQPSQQPFQLLRPQCLSKRSFVHSATCNNRLMLQQNQSLNVHSVFREKIHGLPWATLTWFLLSWDSKTHPSFDIPIVVTIVINNIGSIEEGEVRAAHHVLYLQEDCSTFRHANGISKCVSILDSKEICLYSGFNYLVLRLQEKAEPDMRQLEERNFVVLS